MSSSDDPTLFICSFCDQSIKIRRDQIGHRTKCPKCGRVIRLFPNKDLSIDDRLKSNWFYLQERFLLDPTEIGPINDEQFLVEVSKGTIRADTSVRSFEITQSTWVAANQIKFELLQERIAQREAEQLRRSRKDARRLEIAEANRQKLNRAIVAVVADGRISTREQEQLLEFARAAKIPESDVHQLLTGEADRLLQTVINEVLDDGILEPHEKDRLLDLAAGLGLTLEFTPHQGRRLALCDLAWQLASGTFTPNANSIPGAALGAKETPLASTNLEWLEVVQQKKPTGFPLGGNNYLKLIATGKGLLTNKRVILEGEFNAKKISLTTVERAQRYQDGVFCKRSTGKSVFLKPPAEGMDWDQFALVLEHAIVQQPILGHLPTDSFIPMDAICDIPLEPVSDNFQPSWERIGVEPRYTFRVVGDHIDDRSYWIERLHEGDDVRLSREPSNPVDFNAVAVYDDNFHQLGYLKREVAAWFGPMLDRGYKCRCDAYRKTSSGALIVGVYKS